VSKKVRKQSKKFKIKKKDRRDTLSNKTKNKILTFLKALSNSEKQSLKDNSNTTF